MDVWNIAQKTLTLSPGAPAGPGGPIGPVIPRMPSLPGAPSVPLAPWSPWDKSLLSVLCPSIHLLTLIAVNEH